MKNITTWLSIFLSLLVVGCGQNVPKEVKPTDDVSAFIDPGNIPVPDVKEEEIMIEMDTFFSPDVDLQFDYRLEPDGYTLNASPGEDAYGITLMRTDDFIAMQDMEGTEGPGSINIIIFSNDDNLNAQQWTALYPQYSNYSDDIDATEGIVDGYESVSYDWDGLYPGQSVVVATDEHVYIFSLTTNTNIETMQRDFEAIIATSKL